tara:strand:+ start:28196 stop:28582 length:387 start_codon:yes stop_codon:yes gene_type:complete
MIKLKNYLNNLNIYYIKMNDDEKKILKMANNNNFSDSENSDRESSYSENYESESDQGSYSDHSIIEQETAIENNKIENNNEIEKEVSKKKIILNKKIIKLNMDKICKSPDEDKYDDWITIDLSDSDKP